MSATASLQDDKTNLSLIIDGTPKHVIQLARRLVPKIRFNVAYVVSTLWVDKTAKADKMVKDVYRVGGFLTFLMRKGIEKTGKMPFAHMEIQPRSGPSRRDDAYFVVPPFLEMSLVLFDRSLPCPWSVGPVAKIS